MKRKNREINIFSMSALDLFASAMGAFLLIAVMALPYYLKDDPNLIDEVKSLKKTIASDKLGLATSNEKLQKCISDSTITNHKLETSNKELNECLDRGRDLEGVKNKNSIIQEELKKCREKNSEHETTIKRIKNKAQALQKENNKIQEELKKCREKNSEHETSIKNKAQALQKENKRLKEDVKNAEAEAGKSFCVVKMEWTSQKKQDIDLYITNPKNQTYYYGKRNYEGSKATLTLDSGFPEANTQGAEVWIEKELMKGTYTIVYKHARGTKTNTKVTGSIFTKSFTKVLPVKYMNKGDKIKVAIIHVDSNRNVTIQTY